MYELQIFTTAPAKHLALRRAALFSFLLLLGLSAAGCDRESSKINSEQKAKTQAVVEAPPLKEPARAWYEGAWTGDVGDKKLSLLVSKEAQVTGAWLTSEGESKVHGQVEPESGELRLRLVGPKYFGSLVALRTDASWTGTLRASKPGDVDLAADPPRFGESFGLILRRSGVEGQR